MKNYAIQLIEAGLEGFSDNGFTRTRKYLEPRVDSAMKKKFGGNWFAKGCAHASGYCANDQDLIGYDGKELLVKVTETLGWSSNSVWFKVSKLGT